MRHFDDGAVGAFVSELRETIPQIAGALEAAERDRSAEPLREAHRLLHCLKGAAAMVGLPAFAYLINLAEDLLEDRGASAASISNEKLLTLRDFLPQLAE